MVKERAVTAVTIVVAFSVAILVMLKSETGWWWVAATGVVGLGFLAFSARRGRHTPWAKARQLVGPGHAVVFWKPGCMYCERLLRAIGRDDRVTWVNVRVDKDANAEVRRLSNGDELTPTVLVGERVLRNPSVEEMLESVSVGHSR